MDNLLADRSDLGLDYSANLRKREGPQVFLATPDSFLRECISQGAQCVRIKVKSLCVNQSNSL